MKFPRAPLLIGLAVFLTGAGVIAICYELLLRSVIGVEGGGSYAPLLIAVPIPLGLALFVAGRSMLLSADEEVARKLQGGGIMMGIGMLIAGVSGLCTVTELLGEYADYLAYPQFASSQIVYALELLFFTCLIAIPGIVLFRAGRRQVRSVRLDEPAEDMPDERVTPGADPE